MTTSQVTDASPAAFFSTTPDRDRQDEIARQYVEVTQPAVILGGGEAHWSPDLIARAAGRGLHAASPTPTSSPRPTATGCSACSPARRCSAHDPAVPLADMTTTALDVLSRDPDGFFLFVEEEAVDEMSHANNGAPMLQAMRSLEETVQVAREYVAEHPDTLLIVTGDHECGGLTVENADGIDDGEDGPFPAAGGDQQFVLDWTTTGHTGAPTPVTAEGPGSQELDGFYPNTHLHEVMWQALTR